MYRTFFTLCLTGILLLGLPVVAYAAPTVGNLHPLYAVSWNTETVSLTADTFYIQIDNKKYYPTADVTVHSDPGDATYTTLETTWQSDPLGSEASNTEMRMNMYFSYTPGAFWQLTELRTYNGLNPGDWIYYNPQDEYGQTIQHSLGDTYTNAGTLELKSKSDSQIKGVVHFENLRLQPFTKNAVQKVTGITFTGESLFDGEKGKMRHVFVKWNQLPGDIVYYVYEQPGENKGTDDGWATKGDPITNPYTTIEVLANMEWSIKVQACPRNSTIGCIDSDPVVLPVAGNVKTVAPSSNPNIDELNKKVASLEGKLKDSEKKQNILEQRITDLVNFLKHLFPFFR